MGCCADIACCRGTTCSRERFFVGTRKTDDGDRPRGHGDQKVPAGLCHRRGGLTKYPADVPAQGARGAPWTPGIRGTAGVVRELCGPAAMLRCSWLRAGHAIAPSNRGGKSELRTGGMPGNTRSRQREGKCHRKETALRLLLGPDGKGETVR